METELVIISPQIYHASVIGFAKKAAESNENVCYVSLNKTYKSMLQALKKSSIEKKKFFFIDVISPTVFKTAAAKQCIFLDSLNLNDLGSTLLGVIKKNRITLVIFDSLSSLLVYKKDDEVLDFTNYVLPFLEESGVKATLLCLSDDSEKPAIKQLKMRVG